MGLPPSTRNTMSVDFPCRSSPCSQRADANPRTRPASLKTETSCLKEVKGKRTRSFSQVNAFS